MNKYVELHRRQQEEVNSFPMFFAFNDRQFAEGMKRLGLKPTDTKKIYKLGNTGGFYRKSDAQAFRDMMDRHNREMADAIAEDTTGDGFIFDMFSYELANHEYCITYDPEPTLSACGLTMKQVQESTALYTGWRNAKIRYLEGCEY